MRFDQWMTLHQVQWRTQHLRNQDPGEQNGVTYPHVLPPRHWQLGLWPGIREGTPWCLQSYLTTNHIQRHTSESFVGTQSWCGVVVTAILRTAQFHERVLGPDLCGDRTSSPVLSWGSRSDWTNRWLFGHTK